MAVMTSAVLAVTLAGPASASAAMPGDVGIARTVVLNPAEPTTSVLEGDVPLGGPSEESVPSAPDSGPDAVLGTWDAPGAPAVTLPVVISGTGEISIELGSKALAAKVDGWEGTGIKYSYQWYRHSPENPEVGKAIKGATKSSYVPTSADRNQLVSVRVTPKNVVGAEESVAPVSSEPIPVTLAFQGAVTITNGSDARVGRTLTARVEDVLLNPGDESVVAKLNYQWYRSGKKIKGATKASYTPKASDLNKTLSVKVTAKLGAALSVSKTVKAAKTAKGQFSIEAGLEPKITKAKWPGRKLTASLDKTMVAESGYSISWQWYRDDTKRKGKTKSTYTPVTADRGAHVWVSATLKKKGYASRTLTMTLPQFPGYRDWMYGEWSHAEALISGDVKVGSTLTYSPGSQRYAVHGAIDASNVAGHYTLTPEQVEKYQWYRDGKKIKGATKNTYTITAKDRGKRLKLVVTSSYPGYIGFTRSSRETGRIGDAVLPEVYRIASNSVPSPSLKYRAAAGGKVTLVAPQPGPISNPPADFMGDNLYHLNLPRTYQWFKNGKAIKGATKREYTIAAKDAKHEYTVRISIKQQGFTELYVPSKPAIVAMYGASVSIPGEARVGTAITATATAAWPQSRRTFHYGVTTCTGGEAWHLWYIDAPSEALLQHCAEGGKVVSQTYQWLRDGKAIAGATSENYTPTAKDKGKKLSVRVTYAEVSGTYFPLVLTSKTVKVK